MRNLRNLFLSAVAMLIFAGCSASQPFNSDEEISKNDAQAEETPKEKRLPLAAYEATLNPADFDHEVDVIQKNHSEEKREQTPLEIPKDSLIIQEEIIQGFRIQVFSSANVDEAALIKGTVLGKFASDSVYLVYDAPVYKIRVGDFTSRYEANQRLPEFVEKGYRDAWIVPDRVVQRKLVRVPLQK
jgi:hypothetical protein